MKTRIAAFATFLALTATSTTSSAAPVQYSFSTGAAAFGGPSVAGAPFLNPSLLNGGVSGTFMYDSSALKAVTNADGSFSYFGAAPVGGTGATTTSNLVASVAGLSFSDTYGSGVVGNDTFGTSVKTDIFQLFFDPALATPLPHNLSGFTIDGFRLVNVRMFWIEGQAVPETIGDFLTNQNLPGTVPSFHGRISLDFVQAGNPTGPMSFVFFDGLSVTPIAAIPEPDTYAMLLAGLGLMGFAARRRRGLNRLRVPLSPPSK